jgi:acyl-CoA reductase-like NAD-dependent aldehyde dehydrogenase
MPTFDRTEKFAVRLSERELERLELASRYFRMKPSEYLRQALNDRLDADTKKRVIETELRAALERAPEAWRAMTPEEAAGFMTRLFRQIEAVHGADFMATLAGPS